MAELGWIGRLRLRSGRLANMLLHPVGGLIRRSPDRFVFGQGADLFAGNSKYLFLWLRLHRPDIAAVWITGNRQTRHLLRVAGLPVALRWSASGMIAALRAGVFLFTDGIEDVNVALRRGAMAINLWHGVGLKALPWHSAKARKEPRITRRLRAWFRSFSHPEDSLIVTTSEMMQAHFAGQFHLPAGCCPQIGYPRLDVATDASLRECALRIDREIGFRLLPDGLGEAYIYLPTWRDTERSFLEEALPELSRLAAVLAARGAILYVKLHPRTPDRLPAEHVNILHWPDGIDFQTYLPELTGIITDYSSVLYDWLAIRDEGAILYTFDYDRYVRTDRTLLYAFEENVAGVRVDDFEALLKILAAGTALEKLPVAELQEIRTLFWGGSSNPASAAIVRYVEERLAAANARDRRDDRRR